MQEIATQDSETQSSHDWSWVESSIWTERMLVALVNGVKGGKWFSLWDKVYAARTLQAAWHQVKSNKGGSGIDKVSIERFENKANLYLRELAQSLQKGNYCYVPRSNLRNTSYHPALN